MNNRRRRLIAAGLSSLAAPRLFAAAPSAGTHTVGMLWGSRQDDNAQALDAFKSALAQRGYAEGKNLTLELRFAETRYDRLPLLGAELLAKKVDVIVANGTPAAKAAQRASSRIPIVAVGFADPVDIAIGASLARPGANVTGISNVSSELAIKRLEILLALAPRSPRVGVVFNPDNPSNLLSVKAIDAHKLQMGFDTVALPIRQGAAELQRQLAAWRKGDFDAVYLTQDGVLIPLHARIIGFCLEHRLASIAQLRSFVSAGGLASYGADSAEQWRGAADYVDRILNGAKPAELPFLRPTQFDMALNRRTAGILGISIPRDLLLRADLVVG